MHQLFECRECEMLFALCLLCFQLWFGFEVASRVLRKHFDIWNQMAISIPVGLLVPSLVFFICSTFFGANIFHVILHMLLLGVVSAHLSASRRKSPAINWASASTIHRVAFGVAVLASLILVPHFYFPKPRTLNSVCFGKGYAFLFSLLTHRLLPTSLLKRSA